MSGYIQLRRNLSAPSYGPRWPLHLEKDHPHTQGLIGLWHVGNGWRDLSGKTNVNGTRVGTSLGARNNNPMEVFDADTDGVTVHDTTLSQTGKYTMWAWGLADSLSVAWQTLFKNWSGAGGASAQFHFGRENTTSLLSNYLTDSGGTKGPAKHHINMPISKLTCWASRADGAELSVWQDGIKGTTTVAYNGTLKTTSNDVAIGRHSATTSTQGWIGGILMVGFSDKAFSDSLMFDLWNPTKRWDYFWQPGRVLYYVPAAAAAAGNPYYAYAQQ